MTFLIYISILQTTAQEVGVGGAGGGGLVKGLGYGYMFLFIVTLISS